MKYFLILLFLPFLFPAQSQKWDYVGNIDFDETKDKVDFYLCDEAHIYQYFNNSGGLEYEGEKIAVERIFSEKYNSAIVQKTDAIVRVRFVVNCKGETDRFRILTADYNYQPIEIDKKITSQLLEITKNLKGWKPKTYRERNIDYYQYLTFKIKDGKIDEILP